MEWVLTVLGCKIVIGGVYTPQCALIEKSIANKIIQLGKVFFSKQKKKTQGACVVDCNKRCNVIVIPKVQLFFSLVIFLLQGIVIPCE